MASRVDGISCEGEFDRNRRLVYGLSDGRLTIIDLYVPSGDHFHGVMDVRVVSCILESK